MGGHHGAASVPARGRASRDLSHCDVVFQSSPGPAGRQISGLRGRVNGAATAPEGGTFHVPQPGGLGQLELLDPSGAVAATFILVARPGLPPAPGEGDHSLHDVRVALNHLGYNAGPEATAEGSAVAGPDAALERAVLCFEADAALTPEGITSRQQQAHRERPIRERVATNTRARLRRWLHNDQNGAAPPARDGDALTGDPPPESAVVEPGGLGVDAGDLSARQVGVLGRTRVVLVSIARDDSAPATVMEGGLAVPNVVAPYVEESSFDDHDYGAGHRGPMLGVLELDAAATYRVRLVRENLLPDAPLHATSSLEAAIPSPGPVGAGASTTLAFDVRAWAAGGRDHNPVDLSIRLGGAGGPVVLVLRVVVLRRMDVRCEVIGIRHPHGPPDFVDNRRVRDTFTRCNKLFQQAGLRLVFDGSVTYHLDDEYDYRAADSRGAALDRMLVVRHFPDRLNVYVATRVAFFEANAFLAIGQSTATGADQTAVFCQPDAFGSATTVPHVLAHELGHALGLTHPDRDDLESDQEWMRVTSWTLRRMMFYHTTAPPHLPAWHPFAGGAAAGEMFSLRNHAGDAFDNEVRRLRNRVAGHGGSVYDGVTAGG